MFNTDTTADIITLNSRRPAPDAQDCVQALETYWTALAAGRMMPLRDEVDPRGLADTLDQTFLLERIAPGHARFRLAGQRICDLVGMDLRGMPVSTLITPARRPVLSDSLTALFDEPARVELTLQGPRQGLRGRLAAHILMLPLRDRNGDVSRAIGVMTAATTPARQAQRFDIVGEDRRTLLGFADHPPAAEPAAIDTAYEHAETLRDRVRHRADMRKRLRVVTGDAD